MPAAIYRHFQTREELDKAYDVEASVPDFMVYARQFVEGSASVRRQLPHHREIRFGPTVDEYADIFPASRRGAPVMIFIHGGYWRMLSASDFSFVAKAFADADVTVVIANYALCPKVSISEITRQMQALVAWTFENIADYNGDPENIFVSGHSAGGHLGAMCALTDWAQAYGLPHNLIKGVIPVSGLFDLEPIQHTYLQPDLNIRPEDIRDCSPITRIRQVTTPMLVTYGSEEPSEFSRHSEEFITAWKKVGNRAHFFSQIGRNHFTAITDLAEVDSPLSQEIFRFMRHDPRPRQNRRVSRPSGIPMRSDFR